MKKECKSSITKNHKKNISFFMVFPQKGYIASAVIFRLAPEIKRTLWENQVTNEA